MGSTELVAWWGAVIATLVLIWDVVKWRQSGPKLRSRIVLNANYGDGKIVNTEKIEQGEIITRESYCHIELVNIGSMPSSVMGISAGHKAIVNGVKVGVSNDAFSPHYGKKLPYVLSPGEVWSCRLPMYHYMELLGYGIPEIRVTVSHLKKPIIIRAEKSANKALMLNAENFDGA